MKGLGLIFLVGGVIFGIVMGFAAGSYDFSWLTAISWWIVCGFAAGVFFALDRVFEYLQAIYSSLQKVPKMTQDSFPKLGNSKMNLDSLKDFRMSVQDKENL